MSQAKINTTPSTGARRDPPIGLELDVEPDSQWCIETRKIIDTKLQQLIDKARNVRDERLKQSPGNTAWRKKVEDEFKHHMKVLTQMADGRYEVLLQRERLTRLENKESERQAHFDVAFDIVYRTALETSETLESWDVPAMSTNAPQEASKFRSGTATVKGDAKSEPTLRPGMNVEDTTDTAGSRTADQDEQTISNKSKGKQKDDQNPELKSSSSSNNMHTGGYGGSSYTTKSVSSASQKVESEIPHSLRYDVKSGEKFPPASERIGIPIRSPSRATAAQRIPPDGGGPSPHSPTSFTMVESSFGESLAQSFEELFPGSSYFQPLRSDAEDNFILPPGRSGSAVPHSSSHITGTRRTGQTSHTRPTIKEKLNALSTFESRGTAEVHGPAANGLLQDETLKAHIEHQVSLATSLMEDYILSKCKTRVDAMASEILTTNLVSPIALHDVRSSHDGLVREVQGLRGRLFEQEKHIEQLQAENESLQLSLARLRVVIYTKNTPEHVPVATPLTHQASRATPLSFPTPSQYNHVTWSEPFLPSPPEIPEGNDEHHHSASYTQGLKIPETFSLSPNSKFPGNAFPKYLSHASAAVDIGRTRKDQNGWEKDAPGSNSVLDGGIPGSVVSQSPLPMLFIPVPHTVPSSASAGTQSSNSVVIGPLSWGSGSIRAQILALIERMQYGSIVKDQSITDAYLMDDRSYACAVFDKHATAAAFLTAWTYGPARGVFGGEV